MSFSVQLMGGPQDGMKFGATGEPTSMLRVPWQPGEGEPVQSLLYECPSTPVQGVWKYRYLDTVQ